MTDIDNWISIAKQCKYLPENDLKKLCDIVCDLLLEESNIQPVTTPVTVCGDIHGQFYDLEELFRNGGQVPDTNYVFMGDFVDRGYYSLETFTRLLTLKAKWPDRITLLRGNHESRQITQVYGFYDECFNKYGNANAWKYCCRVFDLLTVAALIDEEVLCVHGGLSPDIMTLDQIRCIERNQEIPYKGAFCDLVWSDPDEVETWSVSPRGAGWLFGAKVTHQFMWVNNLKLICRAHQLVHEGTTSYLWEFILLLLEDDKYCPKYITWIDRERKIFKFVEPHAVSKLWGIYKNRPEMTYSKMGRALRYYYRRGILLKIGTEMHTYQFLNLPKA